MGAGPGPTPVAAPPPIAALYGLVSSARDPKESSDNWENGLKFESEGCAAGGIEDPCDFGPITIPDATAENEFEPFVVWVGYKCSSFGFLARDWEARARQALLAQQSYWVEREFWTGDKAADQGWTSNRFLADVANVDILTESGAVGLTHGLACLEQYIGECSRGQRGMIHATPQVVTHWVGLNLVRQQGASLATELGNVVVPGAGYQGTDPNGNTGTDNVWAYATGMVEVRLGDIELIGGPQDLEIATNRRNNITIRAQRSAAAVWNGCCLGGVRLAVSSCGVGGS